MIKEIRRLELDEETTKALIEMLNTKSYTIKDISQEVDCCYGRQTTTTKASIQFGEFEITISKERYNYVK